MRSGAAIATRCKNAIAVRRRGDSARGRQWLSRSPNRYAPFRITLSCVLADLPARLHRIDRLEQAGQLRLRSQPRAPRCDLHPMAAPAQLFAAAVAATRARGDFGDDPLLPPSFQRPVAAHGLGAPAMLTAEDEPAPKGHVTEARRNGGRPIGHAPLFFFRSTPVKGLAPFRPLNEP